MTCGMSRPAELYAIASLVDIDPKSMRFIARIDNISVIICNVHSSERILPLKLDAISIGIAREESIDAGNLELRIPLNRITGGGDGLRPPVNVGDKQTKVMRGFWNALGPADQMQDVRPDLIPGAAEGKTHRAWNFRQTQESAVELFGSLDVGDIDGNVVDSMG